MIGIAVDSCSDFGLDEIEIKHPAIFGFGEPEVISNDFEETGLAAVGATDG